MADVKKDPISRLRQRNLVAELIIATFLKYGYDEIPLDTVEKADKFKRCVHKPVMLADEYGLALRPDLTPLAAHLVINHKMIIPNHICRLFYIGNCFRSKGGTTGVDEINQVGLELLNSYSPRADAEVMLIAINVLNSLNMKKWILKVGNAGIIRDVLNDVGFSIKHEIMQDLARLTKLDDELNQGIIDTYKRKWQGIYGIPSNMADNLIRLLKAKNNDFEKALESLKEIFPDVHKSVIERIKNIYCVLQKRLGDGIRKCQLDFCLSRELKYYTDIVFELYYKNQQSLEFVCGGGRYDTLFSEISREVDLNTELDVPATGLAFEIDQLMDHLNADGSARIIEPMRKQSIEFRIMITSPPEMLLDADLLASKLRKYNNVSVITDIIGLDEANKRERTHSKRHGILIEINGPWQKDKEKDREKVKVTYLKSGSSWIVTKSNLINLLDVFSHPMDLARSGKV